MFVVFLYPGWKENDIADQLVAAECAAKTMQASFGGVTQQMRRWKFFALTRTMHWQSKCLQNYEELK